MSDESPGKSSSTISPIERPIEYIREIFSRYILLSNRSPLLYTMFQLRMRPIAIRRIQILLSLTAILVVVFWPEDFILQKPYDLQVSFAYWRSITAIASVAGILGLQWSPIVRKNTTLFYTGLISLDMMLAGYLFGSVKGLAYPWFDFLVFIIPMFSILVSVNFLKRFLVALCMSLSYVAFYVMVSPENLNFEYFFHFLPLWFTVLVLTSVIGHSIYYYDYITYEKERALQLKQQEIERLARYDQLTSLLNRSEFTAQAQKVFNQAMRYDNNLAMAMIDLDNFKEINDTYGHQGGDDVLATVGRIIDENVRNADVAARYGGEEFCILLPQTTSEGAREVVERIRKDLESTDFETEEGEQFTVTCSIGVSSLSNDPESLEDLLKQADTGLYEAKDKGRNTTVVIE